MNQRTTVLAAALLAAAALPACDRGTAQNRADGGASGGVAMTVYASPT